MNTAHRGGTDLQKKITVYTNDPVHPSQSLAVGGKVERLYTLFPKRARLVGTLGSEIRQSLTLSTEEKYPLQLESIRAKHGEFIQFELKKLSDEKKAVYEIDVKNTRLEVGRFVDTLYVKTDSKIKPEIEIPVYGYIKPKPETKTEPKPNTESKTP